MSMFGARSGQSLNVQPEPPDGALSAVEYTFSDSEFFLSGHGVRITKTGDGPYALSFDSMPFAADVEVLARVSLAGDYTEESWGVVVRGGGAASSETGHALWCGLIGTFDEVMNHEIFDDGSSNRLNFFPAVGGIPLASARAWIRLRAEGSEIKGRVWLDGIEEPTDWAFEHSDGGDVTAAGWVGLFIRYGDGDNRYCDYFAAGVDGASAPGPDASPAADQYVTRFDEVDPLDQWTERWAQSDVLAIETSADDIMPLDWNRNMTGRTGTPAGVVGGRLRIQPNVDRIECFFPIDQPSDIVNAESLMRWRAPSESGSRARGGMALRSGPYGTSGYLAQLDYDGNVTPNTTVAIRLPGTTNYASDEYTDFPWQFDVDWLMRARIENGVDVKMKVWPAGEDEPAAWTLEAEVSQDSPGLFGVAGTRNQGSPILEVDYYALDTGGNTIPSPD